MPWQSRHKANRDRATLIAILLVLAIGITALISANISLIGRFFVIFAPHG